MDESLSGPIQGRNPIEALSKEEIINKYKALLGIAKKAKHAKDEYAEENRLLKDSLARSETQKEADKNALLTMKEMIEEFTNNKLQLTTQLSELQNKSRKDDERLAKLVIENESLKRQLDRLNEDNEALLQDIDRMEEQLKQVNLLGIKQKEDLTLLEFEVNKLKEAESLNKSLKNEIAITCAENEALKNEVNSTNNTISELQDKYLSIKETNSEQRKKFNALKDRFVDVYRKLKQLKECKRILLETQYEYSDAVSNWQKEIVEASRRLCTQMNSLKTENIMLLRKLQLKHGSSKENSAVSDLVTMYLTRIKALQKLVEKVFDEQQQQNISLNSVENENKLLREKLNELQVSEKIKLDEGEEQQKKFNEFFVNKQVSLDTCDDCTAVEQQEQLCSQEVLGEKQYDKVDVTNKKTAKDIIKELKKENQKLGQELFTLSQAIGKNDKLCATMGRLKKENKSLLDEISLISQKSEKSLKTLRDELKHLQMENSELLNQGNDKSALAHENKQLLEKVSELNNLLEQKQSLLTSIEADKADLIAQKNIENKTANVSNEELEDVKSKLLASTQTIEELETRYERKSREHTDLLGEMRELNEALKARGDVISRQQAAQLELVAEMKQTTARLQQIELELYEKSNAINDKDTQVIEISNEIEGAKNKILELQQVCASNEEKVQLLSDELQQLRQCDSQSEILSTTTEDASTRIRELDETFEEKYNKLRTIAVKLKRKLQEQTAYVAEMEEQQSVNKALKIEYEAIKKQHEDGKIELEQLKKQSEIQKHEIHKLKTSRKQANVLNLEIEAAEKSLNESINKLASKINEVEALNESLHSKEQTIIQLRKEIELLEAAKSAECIHSKELKEQIDRLQAQIKDAVHSKQQAVDTSKELERSLESLKLELEDVKLQLANIASSHETVLSTAKAKTQQVEQQYFALQAENNNVQTSLKSTERSLADLRVEFLDYKVKAQTVLRKNQNKDSTKEREQEEELLALRANEKQLQTNAHMYQTQLTEKERQLEMLQEDNASLQRRSRELIDLVNELRQQNESMAQEQRQQMQEQQAALKQQRLQIEQLDACHKEQLFEMETSYLRQIEELKTEHSKAVRQPTIVGGVSQTNAPALSATEQSKIDFLLMEREDAEGSEEAAEALAHIAASRKISTASSSRRSQHDFMPLDELLSSPMNVISDTVTTITSNSLGRADDHKYIVGVEHKHIELQATKERLQKQESHVRHLTALLAENEQDLAKLTQMNDMLKEELRRQERSVEREQHMHNSEYLKNVIVKFLTLNNGDEKTRLVPVINTILKLSRSEAEMLTCVAKGQKVTDAAAGRSWGNFLPSWGNNN